MKNDIPFMLALIGSVIFLMAAADYLAGQPGGQVTNATLTFEVPRE